MNLVIFLAYILCTFGITEMFIFFSGPFSIFDRIREIVAKMGDKFVELFSCVACFSTWVGIILSTINYLFIPVAFTPFNIILGGTGLWWLIIPLDAALTMGSSWTLYQLDEYLEKNAKQYEDE